MRVLGCGLLAIGIVSLTSLFGIMGKLREREAHGQAVEQEFSATVPNPRQDTLRVALQSFGLFTFLSQVHDKRFCGDLLDPSCSELRRKRVLWLRNSSRAFARAFPD